MKTFLAIVAPFAALAAIGYYDYNGRTCEIVTDYGFATGNFNYYERCTGRLGLPLDDRYVGPVR